MFYIYNICTLNAWLSYESNPINTPLFLNSVFVSIFMTINTWCFCFNNKQVIFFVESKLFFQSKSCHTGIYV